MSETPQWRFWTFAVLVAATITLALTGQPEMAGMSMVGALALVGVPAVAARMGSPKTPTTKE